jgi:hypothetical protein
VAKFVGNVPVVVKTPASPGTKVSEVPVIAVNVLVKPAVNPTVALFAGQLLMQLTVGAATDDHAGTPPDIVRTAPVDPMGRAVIVLVVLAYQISPVVSVFGVVLVENAGGFVVPCPRNVVFSAPYAIDARVPTFEFATRL